jgi:alpha-ketoglutarate-dependent taurine dioxygenase
MATTTLQTEKLTEHVGAEVKGIDVDRLRNDEDLPGAIMEALEANGVLVFRGLNIDDETQMRFCRKLGEVQLFEDQKIPEIFVVTLDPQKNPKAPYLQATVFWHVDDTIRPVPSKATMLSAKVLPSSGGDTEFVSSYTAYDNLTDDERERYDDLRVMHSQVRIQSKVHPNPTPEQLEEWRATARIHPLVWKQRSGRRSLVLGETVDHIVGMDEDEGRALLEELEQRATAPELVYRHVWSEGDTIFWDNRGVMHRVMPYDAMATSSRREMHRCTLVGDEPIQ